MLCISTLIVIGMHLSIYADMFSLLQAYGKNSNLFIFIHTTIIHIRVIYITTCFQKYLRKT